MARSTIAKSLRKQMTDAERLLWEWLRCKQMEGYKFRRQCPIGRYIVDLVCLEKGLVIEVDGGQRPVQHEADAARSARIATRGYKVLRFCWKPYGVTFCSREIALHPTPPVGGERFQCHVPKGRTMSCITMRPIASK